MLLTYISKRAQEICNNSPAYEQMMNRLLRETTARRGISCFSESDDILLMWSHYADSHRGLCLTFNIENDANFFSIPFKVAYPNSYPEINPFIDNKRREIQLILATKSQEWAYEKEVRVVKEKDVKPKFRGAIAFDPNALAAKKFGYKSSPEQIRTIKNLASKIYSHVKFYTSTIKTRAFGIEFHEIN